MQKNKAPNLAICEGTVFSILQDRSASYIQNRYKLGRIQQGRLLLNKLECAYLFLKKKIAPENTLLNRFDRLLERLGMDNRLLDIFIVYNILKNRGFYVKMEMESLYYRRSPRVEFKGPVRVIRESGDIEFGDMVANGECVYAAIDDDNDVTIFMSESWSKYGGNEFVLPEQPELISFNGLFAVKTSQVPFWFGTEFGELKVLNKLETSFLLGTAQEDQLESQTQLIFNDLIDRKFIVKTGFKYGANFRIYSGTIEEHADYLVHILDRKEQWYKISRAVRVAQGVKKEMVFSGILNSSPTYIGIKRVRDPFSTDN